MCPCFVNKLGSLPLALYHSFATLKKKINIIPQEVILHIKTLVNIYSLAKKQEIIFNGSTNLNANGTTCKHC